MKVKDLRDNYGGQIAVSHTEDPERELKPGDKVFLEKLKSARHGEIKRYIKITGNSPTSWKQIEEYERED